MNDFEEFKKQVVKSSENRHHKVTNCLTTETIFWELKRQKLIDKAIDKKLFRLIVREFNLHLAEKLSQGEDIQFPHHMGRVEIRKYKPVVKFKDGKLQNGMPVDWDATIRLWYEDPECMENKQLVRRIEKEVFKVFYNKSQADFENKTYYDFQVNRELKRSLKDKIKNREIDAFKFRQQ